MVHVIIFFFVLSSLVIAFYMEMSLNATFITKFIMLDKLTFTSNMISRHMRCFTEMLSNA